MNKNPVLCIYSVDTEAMLNEFADCVTVTFTMAKQEVGFRIMSCNGSNLPAVSMSRICFPMTLDYR